MARKPQSFKLNEKKKVIVFYTNVDPEPAEQLLINFYLGKGYQPMFEEKKASITIEQMREALKADEEALKKFNEAYKEEKNGFFKACKIYTDWKKAQRKQEKENQEQQPEA